MLLQPITLRRLGQARELLRAQSEQPLRIDEVARQLGISPFHFIRLFEAAFGVTPHQFRIQARIEQAKLLLAHGQPVTSVCLEVGFSSLGSFSTLFRREVGLSPSAYRRSVRALAQVPAQLERELMPGCFSMLGRLPAWAFRSFREASEAASAADSPPR